MGSCDGRDVDGGRVGRVLAGDDRVEARAVADVLRDRADLVEARCERDDAEAADGAVGRAQADVAAERRRLLDRAARVRAEPPGCEPGRDSGSGAAARAARDAVGIPGIVGRAVGRVLGRRAHREFVGVRLADHRQAGGAAAGRDGRVEHRHVAGEDLRAGRRLDALGRDHVLERDRNAVALRALDRPQVAVQLAVPLGDRVEVRAMELGAGDLPALQQPERLLDGQSQGVDGHAVGGTLKRSPSRAGALAKTSSSGSDGRGSSSAQALTSSSG